jgi:hypothetical protein
MKPLSPEKLKLLNGLLNFYKQEIEAIYAINVSWKQLKDAAKDKCAEDFDQALIARETLLDELADLRDGGIVPNEHELQLYYVDQELVKHEDIIKSLYGLDVRSFLNIKPPKLLKK